MAANLCAHSIFGEDALANVSIEKSNPQDPSGPIIGHIRIRAKSQGMALSLGDKVCSFFHYQFVFNFSLLNLLVCFFSIF